MRVEGYSNAARHCEHVSRVVYSGRRENGRVDVAMHCTTCREMSSPENMCLPQRAIASPVQYRNARITRGAGIAQPEEFTQGEGRTAAMYAAGGAPMFCKSKKRRSQLCFLDEVSGFAESKDHSESPCISDCSRLR